jgi:hypothetical protein
MRKILGFSLLLLLLPFWVIMMLANEGVYGLYKNFNEYYSRLIEKFRWFK